MNMGVSYMERLQAHKVGGGSGRQREMEGRPFEGSRTYPWSLNFPIATDDVHDLGNGVKMRSICTITGNAINCRSTSDNMFLEVINSQVEDGTDDPWHGKVTGNTMSWKFHLENPNEPVLNGVIAEGLRDPIELTIIEPRKGPLRLQLLERCP